MLKRVASIALEQRPRAKRFQHPPSQAFAEGRQFQSVILPDLCCGSTRTDEQHGAKHWVTLRSHNQLASLRMHHHRLHRDTEDLCRRSLLPGTFHDYLESPLCGRVIGDVQLHSSQIALMRDIR